MSLIERGTLQPATAVALFSRREPMKKFIEIFQGRIDGVGFLHGRGDGFQGLVSIAGDADHDGFIVRNAPGFDQLFCDGDFGATRGFGENTFGAGQQLDAFEDFLIRDAFTPAAGFTDGLNDLIAVGGITDRDGAGDGVGLHWRNEISALMERVDNRGTAARLRRIDFAPGIFDQANLDELF